MMRRTRTAIGDGCLLVLGTAFWLGCIAATTRSPKVLDSGQVSSGISYMDGSVEDEDAPLRLAAIDARVGLPGGTDMGLMHTWDLTQDNDGVFGTAWWDFRAQLGGRNGRTGTPYLTTGLGKGFVYDPDAELHITTLPVALGMEVTPSFRPFILYRLEFVSEDFLGDFSDPRHSLFLGMEMDLVRGTAVVPKLGLSLGVMNSLAGGGGEDVVLVNAGLTVTAGPRSRPRSALTAKRSSGLCWSIGIGPGLTTESYRWLGRFEDRNTWSALETDVRVGYRVRPTVETFIRHRIAWSHDEITLTHMTTGVGATVSVRPKWHATATIGRAALAAPFEKSDGVTGLGLAAGVGYELSRGQRLELGLAWTGPKETFGTDFTVEYSTWSVALTYLFGSP